MNIFHARGIQGLLIGSTYDEVIASLGKPTDVSVAKRPKVVKWLDLEVAISFGRVSLIQIEVPESRRLLLPDPFHGLEQELEQFSIEAIRNAAEGLSITTVDGLTFDDQAAYRIGRFWTVVVCGSRLYSLSVSATGQEIAAWQTGTH
jgi:hypothetical protein